MMLERLHRHRALLAPFVTLIALLLLGLLLYIPIQHQRHKYEDALGQQTPRIERLLGLREAAPALGERLQQYKQVADTLAFPPEADPNKLTNELPNRLRQLAQQAGLTLSAMRPLPARWEGNLDILQININMQAELHQLQSFLTGLEQPPRLWVDSMTLQSIVETPGQPQILIIDLNLAALRRIES
jgi:Tfp pilus assembly protein PilO